MEMGGCWVRGRCTGTAHPCTSIHSSHTKQHKSLYFSHCRGDKCLNYPEQVARKLAETEFHVSVGRHFQHLFFQVSFLPIIPHPLFHPPILLMFPTLPRPFPLSLIFSGLPEFLTLLIPCLTARSLFELATESFWQSVVIFISFLAFWYRAG